MNWIENQPVFFGTTDSCDDDEFTYVQLVDNTDISQVQFQILPCSGAPQLMPDPEFDDPVYSWSLGDNWGVAYNILCSQGESASDVQSVYQFDVDNYYQINIIVDSISSGGAVSVYLGATLIGELEGTGTFSFYGFPTEVGGETKLTIAPDPIGTKICISSITAYEIATNIIFAFYNSDGAYQTLLDYNHFASDFHFAKDTVTIDINWSELSLQNQCYYICLFDPCENTNGQNYPSVISNCTFTGSATGWTLSNATYTANTVTLDGGTASSLSQVNVFGSYSIKYFVKIIISAVSGTITVSFGTNVVATITTTGTHIVSGYAIGSLDLAITGESLDTATIDSACAVITSTSQFTCNLQSGTFKVGDFSDGCTKVINACNNEDGLGFVFTSSTFSPRLRVKSKFRQAKFKNERTIHEDSVGKKSVVYFSGRKEKNLCIDQQPEFIHDFLRLLLGFDNVYIDNVKYVIDDDEYTVIYNEASDNVGDVKLLVSKQTQNVKNINTTDTENNCNLAI